MVQNTTSFRNRDFFIESCTGNNFKCHCVSVLLFRHVEFPVRVRVRVRIRIRVRVRFRVRVRVSMEKI